MEFKPTASIKLVIWDLDDTFWNGTLSEGDISLIGKNIEIVKTLADRGIMSSISSKNDLAPVKDRLVDAGIWDYFIFPQVSWTAKGGSIAQIIDHANLRAENTLFIDDNSINIEEARFLFPTMMIAYPQDVLPVLLDLDEAKGKDDRSHSQLSQYKKLEKKVADQTQTSLKNEDFLRQCEIKLRFEFDIEPHFDRIIELINRSNQLNFTKIRLVSEEAIAKFKKNLQRFDVFSAAIFARDRYGDHGLIGFYMQLKKDRINKLVHFVWSCRMMNAGLEQYVFERLGEPIINIVGPVSNPIKVFDQVDWVAEITERADIDASNNDPRLLFIGACDLTAVASYCSRNRVEYVNGVKSGVTTRFDDFGFVLADRAKVEASTALDKIPCWDKSDLISFRKDLAVSDVLIISLSAAMNGAHLLTDDGVVVRVHPDGLGDFVDFHPWAECLKGCKLYDLNTSQRNRLLEMSLEFINKKAEKAKYKFLLGANTRELGSAASKADLDLRIHYNSLCENFCQLKAGWHFVSIDGTVAEENLQKDGHYSRIGYLEIANYINGKLHSAQMAAEVPLSNVADDPHLIGLIRSGQPMSRFKLFGYQRGRIAHVKRMVKLTPLYRFFRKTLIKLKKDSLLV